MMSGKKFCGNCDLKLSMGCNDTMSAKYVSELLGIATVETLGVRKDARI